VEREDLAGTCYLFGTVHLKAEKVFGFLPKGLECLKQCDAVATEFNLDEAIGQSSANSLDLPEDYSLNNYLSTKMIAKLEKVFFRELGIPMDNFQNMHPFVITSMLPQSVMPDEMKLSLDETIWQLGKELNKSPHGLETFASQMKLITELPLKKQAKQLKGIAKDFSKFRKQNRKLVDLYANAELARLNKLALKQAKGFRKLMVYDRNRKMCLSFLEIAKNERLFAAVGAGHLPGEKGMLRMLKQDGCVVKPIAVA